MNNTLKAIIAGTLTGGLLLVITPYLIAQLNTLLLLPQKATTSTTIIGLTMILLAVTYWWYCAYQLSSKGKGTPAPIASTKKLVVQGPYKKSRNPMYLCYQAILWGTALTFGHLLLFAYATIMTLFIHYYVRCVEEPRMRKKFKEEYDNYCQHVRRWLGKKN